MSPVQSNPEPCCDAHDATHQDQVQLNPHFRHNLLAALTGNQTSPWSDAAVVLKPGANRPTITSLESYMCAKWNGVLHYLVGTSDSGFDEPADEVKRFLVDTDLMRKNGKEGVAMTNHGIEFLLKDVHIQVCRSGVVGMNDVPPL